jgi:hypothetical protein
MLLFLGLTFAIISIAAAIHHELRSAAYGIELSNGIEVLVSPEMYRDIVHQYRTLDEPEDWKRWDQAVLDVLRPGRPREWKFLAQSLGYQVTGEGVTMHRRRHTAAQGRVRGMSPRS